MIDRYILPLQTRILAPIASILGRFVTADQITLIGFIFGLGAFAAIASSHFIAGAILIALNRLADGLDGAVARIRGTTDRGAFLDIALDFMFYALVPLGFACADPQTNALPAAILITSFVGTGSSFLAFALLAERNHITADAYPSKGIYYLTGIAEGFETILFFAIICFFPPAFPVLALIFAIICFVSTVLRWRAGWVLFTVQKRTDS